MAYDPIVTKVVSLTVSTSAYTSGYSLVTGALTISDILPPDRLWGVVCGLRLISRTVITSSTADVYFYDSNPSGTTFTANAAHSIAAADLDKVIDVVACSTLTSEGGSTILSADHPLLPIRLATPILYASIVYRGTTTFGGAAYVRMRLDVMQQS